MKRNKFRLIAAVVICSLTVAVAIRAARSASASATANGHIGYVYTLNNDGRSNGVVVLARNADGTLTEIEGSPFGAGGKGLVVPAGGDFDAQGAIRIPGKHLIETNPGSN